MLGVPSSLLRFVGQDEHAFEFIAGQIRFGLLDCYRVIEASRRDEKEGRVSFVWGLKESDWNIHYRGRSMNPYYILCTSHPDVNVTMMTKNFGSFIIRIGNPLALLERIKVAWRNHEWAFADNAEVAPVVYNKDELLKKDRYFNAPSHYSYSQKPKSFVNEREFRYVLTCSDDTKLTLINSLTLPVGDCSDICYLV